VLHSVQNSNYSVKYSASSSQDPIQRQNISMLNQFHPCIQDSIENIIDVKADGNCGYRAIAALLGMGEESLSLVRNHLHKELTSWSDEYMNLVGGIERFEELKCDVSSIGACFPRIFFINGFLCFFKDE